jgi:hypothetical protein
VLQLPTFRRASLPAAVLLCLLAGTSGALAPIAHYPLQSDNLDATGLNGPMTLTNAPFENGGVYCNGIYYPNDTVNGYEVITPSLPQLNFSSFAASIEFRMSEYPVAPFSPRPIIICGSSYRFLGAEVYQDGTIALRYNNANVQTTPQVVGLDSWHHVLVTYDASTTTGKLFLDGLFVTSAVFTLEHGAARDVLTENPAQGRSFKGWLRHLVAYDSAFDPTPVEPGTWGRVKTLYR